ncbi:hypothetical protein [Microtetraspora malaysiensis]|uniref:Uncharacterized protein n=1 Tax=Microtetraspora malaysiensis TaxID=161358 RepID=A0ABW6T408_9ACTN
MVVLPEDSSKSISDRRYLLEGSMAQLAAPTSEPSGDLTEPLAPTALAAS